MDRFLFTRGWGESFAFLKQEAEVRMVSDHCPVVLDSNPPKWGPTPFRFENIWLEHKSFGKEFVKWWKEKEEVGWEGYKFLSKLRNVKRKVESRSFWGCEIKGSSSDKKIKRVR